MRRRQQALGDLGRFIAITAECWMENGEIKRNSYGVQVWLAPRAGNDFSSPEVFNFGATLEDAEHDVGWYQQNAAGKLVICHASGMDSHEAVAVWQGLVLDIDGAFPWGGAVIDNHYGLAVGVSGFKADEDLQLARAIRDHVVRNMDRLGQALLDDARERAKSGGGSPDRMTRDA